MGLYSFHNASLDVLKLQAQVLASKCSHVPVVGDAEVWDSLAQGIASLNTFKSFALHCFGLIGLCAAFVIMLLLFCTIGQIGWRQKRKLDEVKREKSLNLCLWHLNKNKKGEKLGTEQPGVCP